MTRAGGVLGTGRRWRIGVAIAVVSLSGHAQSTARADAALRQIDQRQCEAAVETINQGMLDNEPKSFYIAGQLFEYGFCLLKNVPRSTRMYERGAALGDRESARTLALMHARGEGVAQSYQQAGRWYGVMRQEKVGVAEASVATFATPEVVIRTYTEAVADLAVAMLAYPREAIEKGVTGTVKVRFDPRFARVTLLSSADNTGRTGAAAAESPNRHDFERVLIAAYADAVRILPKPPMSPNIDNSIEREVLFDRKVYVADEPNGLQALPRR